MNYKRLRRSRWWAALAYLAMASTMSGAWLTVTHGSLAADSACASEWETPTRGGGSTDTRLDSGAGRAPAPEHCFVCHWLRSLQSLIAQAQAPPVFVEPCVSVQQMADAALVCITIHNRSGRSPPA